MNISRTFFALWLMMAVALASVAAPLPPASEVLSSSIAALKKMKALEASFTATYNGASSSGKMLLAGGAFRLTTPEMSTWFDGHTQWAYSPSAKEVNVSEPTFEELQQINPFAVLQSVQKQFTARRVKAPAGMSRVELTLQRVPKSQYAKVVLTVNDATRLLAVQIDVTGTDGVTTAIKVNAIKEVKSPGATAFRFPAKQYPGVEVIDLR